MNNRQRLMAAKSDSNGRQVNLCPSQPIIGNLPIQLTTAQGIPVSAVAPVETRMQSTAEDLHLRERRSGPGGTTELLARFFAVRDKGEAGTFQPGWMAATPTPAQYLVSRDETCTFAAGAFGYRLALVTGILFHDSVIAFCEDPATIGFGISGGRLYITASIDNSFSAVAAVNPDTDFQLETLPDVKLAHGNAIMLELVDSVGGGAVAARCLRLPAEFISKLRRQLVEQTKVGRIRSGKPQYTAGVFASTKSIKRIEGRGAAVIGKDCPVFSAWISEAAAVGLADGRHDSSVRSLALAS
jgi:hypothetical protein